MILWLTKYLVIFAFAWVIGDLFIEFLNILKSISSPSSAFHYCPLIHSIDCANSDMIYCILPHHFRSILQESYENTNREQTLLIVDTFPLHLIFTRLLKTRPKDLVWAASNARPKYHNDFLKDNIETKHCK